VPAALPPADPALLAEAVALAREAGELTLRYFRTDDLVIDRKGDGTPVTEADRAAERLIREHLANEHPDDGILGEEEGEHAGPSGRRWVVDPIDGTKAFSHGVPTYSNLIALEDEHGPAIGVVNLPGLGETVYAGRGLGCWAVDHGDPAVDAHPAHVSTTERVRGAYLTTCGFDYWPSGWLDGVRAAGLQMRTWGDGWGYALVATGRVDAMVDPVAASWDLAPVPVIATESGGRFTDHGGEPSAHRGSGVFTNGLIHDELRALLEGPPPTDG
jgi:histidinol phosphatase-like enzyme (inositol monophosphatase family)